MVFGHLMLDEIITLFEGPIDLRLFLWCTSLILSHQSLHPPDSIFWILNPKSGSAFRLRDIDSSAKSEKCLNE